MLAQRDMVPSLEPASGGMSPGESLRVADVEVEDFMAVVDAEEVLYAEQSAVLTLVDQFLV